METHREETKRLPKEAMVRWNKVELKEIRYTKFVKKKYKSRRVEGGVNDGKNSWIILIIDNNWMSEKKIKKYYTHFSCFF